MKKILILGLLLCLCIGFPAGGEAFDLEKANPVTVSILNGTEIVPQALQNDLEFYLDMIFGFLPTVQGSGNGLMAELSRAFDMILTGGGGTCPVVTVSPPISGFVLPRTLTVTVDYGSGCVAEDGSTMSGSWKLKLTDIVQEFTEIGADFTFTMSELTQNGMLISNGTLSGYLSLDSSGSDQELTVFVTTPGLSVSEFATLSGSVRVVAVGEIGLFEQNIDKVTVTPR